LFVIVILTGFDSEDENDDAIPILLSIDSRYQWMLAGCYVQWMWLSINCNLNGVKWSVMPTKQLIILIVGVSSII